MFLRCVHQLRTGVAGDKQICTWNCRTGRERDIDVNTSSDQVGMPQKHQGTIDTISGDEFLCRDEIGSERIDLRCEGFHMGIAVLTSTPYDIGFNCEESMDHHRLR